MNDRQNWMARQRRLAVVLLSAGAVVFAAGALLPRLFAGLDFNTRIVSGAGILLLGIGAAYLVRYTSLRRDPQGAGRLLNEERDERSRLIRERAGSRAYWVSALMVYALLLWESFSSNGSLPQLSSNALWFALAACVVLPFLVFVFSLVRDQNRL